MQMDQQIVQNVRQRQLQEQQNRLESQRLQNELAQIRAQSRARRRSGMQPNRARTVYPNRPQAGSPLQQHVQDAAEQFRQRQQERAQAYTDSPYVTPDTERQPSAVLRSGDQTFTVEDDQIVTRQGGDVTGRVPAAGQPAAPSRRSQSKLAALQAAGADQFVSEGQLSALQQMAADDEIDLQEFRQHMRGAVQAAESQRDRAEGGRQGLRPVEKAYVIRDEAQAAQEEAQRAGEMFGPQTKRMSVEEYRKQVEQMVGDQSYMPFSWGEGITREEADQRIAQFKLFKQKQQAAADRYEDFKKLAGFSDDDQQYTRDNPATPETQEDFNALPSGAVFRDPDSGELMRKP
jgi:hypothetical protein